MTKSLQTSRVIQNISQITIITLAIFSTEKIVNPKSIDKNNFIANFRANKNIYGNLLVGLNITAKYAQDI